MQTPILIAAGAAVVLGISGGLATRIGPWYRDLAKPWFQPPDWLFGPAWTVILSLAAWSGVVAWTHAATPAQRMLVITLFALNAVFFSLWSPLFFVMKRPDWALREVVLLWLSLVALFVGLYPIAPLASVLITPYLLWVTFATWLNRAIVKLNAPFGARA